jgi:hypothetical protein
MNLNALHNNAVSLNLKATGSFIAKNESFVALKNEAEEETLTEKYMAETSA